MLARVWLTQIYPFGALKYSNCIPCPGMVTSSGQVRVQLLPLFRQFGKLVPQEEALHF